MTSILSNCYLRYHIFQYLDYIDLEKCKSVWSDTVKEIIEQRLYVIIVYNFSIMYEIPIVFYIKHVFTDPFHEKYKEGIMIIDRIKMLGDDCDTQWILCELPKVRLDDSMLNINYKLEFVNKRFYKIPKIVLGEGDRSVGLCVNPE